MYRRRETNAGITEEQWKMFGRVWNDKWKVYFDDLEVTQEYDEAAYADNPEDVPDHHKYWIKAFRDNLSEALNFSVHSEHIRYENLPLRMSSQVFSERLDVALGEINDTATIN